MNTQKNILLAGNNMIEIGYIKTALNKFGINNIFISSEEKTLFQNLLNQIIDIVIIWKPFFNINGEDVMKKVSSRIKCFNSDIDVIIIDTSPYSSDQYSSVFLNAKHVRWGHNDYITKQIFNLME